MSVAPQITSDRTLVDVGQAHRLTVTGRAGAAVQLFADGALLRTATTSAGGVSRWDLRLAQRTRYHATVDGVPTRTVTVQARRTVSIGISHADGSYTFSGRVTSPQAGVQVTLARLDSRTKQVTGVVSTRTTVDGHYEVRTSLPAGFAGYYALTGAHAGLEAGRSRLYGLTVHAVPRSASR